MRLGQLRNLAEQDTTSSSVAASGTDSGDIATYPFPMFWSPSPSIPRLFAPKTHVLPSSHLGKMLRKRKKPQQQESLEYTPWTSKDSGLQEAMESLGKELQKRLVPYGFNIAINNDSVDVISSSGRIFEYKVVDRYITLSEGKTNISIDSQLGISADRPLFMAFPFQEGFSSNGAWKIAESSWWSILKYDMLLEVAPFIDYSGLEDEVLAKLNEHFILLPARSYRGTFDHVGLYQKMFAPDEEIPSKVNEAMDLDHFKPINNWTAKFAHFDPNDLRRAIEDVEKFGVKPSKRGNDISWGDDLRIRFSPNGIGIVEVAVSGHWYAIHAVPIVPEEYHDEYAEELRDFIKSYQKPQPTQEAWDMPDIIWRIWEANAGDPNYNSGVCFHKDGVWGIDYATAGMGRGTFDASVIEAPFIQYRMTPVPEGLEFRSEQVFRDKQSLKIAPWDIKVLFYKGFDVEDMVRFIGRFTFSS